MFAGRSWGGQMTPVRTSAQPEQRDLFVYDGQVLLCFVDHTHSLYQSRLAALAAARDAIELSG
jgi:hypothetical protein